MNWSAASSRWSEPTAARVVSISLGSRSRDWTADLEPLGVPLVLERRAAEGGYLGYAELLRQLDQDPAVAAIGLGGINLYLFGSLDWRVAIRKAEEFRDLVRNKPVCDGWYLKRYWEPDVVRRLAEAPGIELRGSKALMVCATDRWGMAAELANQGADLEVGDLRFALDVPISLGSLATLERVTRVILPFVARSIPFEWLYPTGESRAKPAFRASFDRAEWIAGDWKFIEKRMPAEPSSLAGKSILTNTTTPANVNRLRELGVRRLVTTTPSLAGRSFGTNVIEAAVCAISGKSPESLDLETFRSVFGRLGWDDLHCRELA